MMGWQFIGRTLYSTVMLSAALYVLPEMELVKEDMIYRLFLAVFSAEWGQGLYSLEAVPQAERICWLC